MLVDKQIEKVVYGNNVAKYFVTFVYEQPKLKSFFDVFKSSGLLCRQEEKESIYFLSETDAVIYAKYASAPSDIISLCTDSDWKDKRLKKYIVSDLGVGYTKTELDDDSLKIKEKNYHMICILNTETDKSFYFFYDDEPGMFGTPWYELLGRSLSNDLAKAYPDIKYYPICDTFEDILNKSTELSKIHSEKRIEVLKKIDEIEKNNALKNTIVSSEKLSIGTNNEDIKDIRFKSESISKETRELLDSRNTLIQDEIARIEKTKQFLLALIR